MLTRMRAGASSWPAKIFLGIIALSFVGWGVGDIFVSRGETTVADVGARQIDIRDLQFAYNTRFRGLSGQADPGSELARSQARRVLDHLIIEAVEANMADELGVTVGDDTLRASIADNEIFFDASGSFDAAVFSGVLATNGLTEASYLDQLGRGIASDQLTASIGAAPPLPEVVGRAHLPPPPGNAGRRTRGRRQ